MSSPQRFIEIVTKASTLPSWRASATVPGNLSFRFRLGDLVMEVCSTRADLFDDGVRVSSANLSRSGIFETIRDNYLASKLSEMDSHLSSLLREDGADDNQDPNPDDWV